MLDFAYATGLRISELVGAKLGAIDSDAHGDTWIRVIGKGRKAGKVVIAGGSTAGRECDQFLWGNSRSICVSPL